MLEDIVWLKEQLPTIREFVPWASQTCIEFAVCTLTDLNEIYKADPDAQWVAGYVYFLPEMKFFMHLSARGINLETTVREVRRRAEIVIKRLNEFLKRQTIQEFRVGDKGAVVYLSSGGKISIADALVLQVDLVGDGLLSKVHMSIGDPGRYVVYWYNELPKMYSLDEVNDLVRKLKEENA